MPFSLYPDNRKKKRSLPRRFPVIFPLVVFILILIGYQISEKTYNKPSIGVVELNGIILESETIIKKLRILESNPLVKGIIIHINSPGGAVAPSQEIFTEILRIRQFKKVYASIASTAVSGGYYVAIGADKIYANPGSMVGSIGAIIQTFNFEELLNKIGIKSEVIKSGKNKDMGSIFRPIESEERKLLESVIFDTHDQFVTAIADRRPMELEEVKSIADGRVFTGRQAKQIGLVDQLASFRETAEELRKNLGIKEEMSLVYTPDKEKLIESIIELDSVSILKKISSQMGLFYLTTSFLEKQ
ncbi:signal peptide peptidase SppA [bacterium]|nr:signal peptide peptidase SppA [bacterium]